MAALLEQEGLGRALDDGVGVGGRSRTGGGCAPRRGAASAVVALARVVAQHGVEEALVDGEAHRGAPRLDVVPQERLGRGGRGGDEVDLERAALDGVVDPLVVGLGLWRGVTGPAGRDGRRQHVFIEEVVAVFLAAPKAADSSALSPVSTSARYSATKEPSATLPERPRLSTNASSREVAEDPCCGC